MYLEEINKLYFLERKDEVENPQFKNPFDKIDNSYPNYDSYNVKRNDKKTTKVGKDRPHSPTIWIDGVEIPAEINWNAKNNFTPVKDQGDCNACYAFGAISGIEAHQVLYKQNSQTYSEQEILDCSYDNEQCVGG